MIRHIVKQPINYFLSFFIDGPIKNSTSYKYLEHDIYHTNVITMQVTIVIAQVFVLSDKKKKLLLTCLTEKLCRYTIQ